MNSSLATMPQILHSLASTLPPALAADMRIRGDLQIKSFWERGEGWAWAWDKI
jgi:hypothetical protein